MFKRPGRLCVNVPAALCLLLIPASSSAQFFDFEDVPATFISPPDNARPGGYNELSMTKEGLTVTIYRVFSGGGGFHTNGGSPFDVVLNEGNQGGKPANWGKNSLDPFAGDTLNDQFVADFSKPILAASIQAGDYGADSDFAFMNAFGGLGGGGTFVAGTNMFLGDAGFPTIAALSLSSTGPIWSLTFGGGSGAGPNSLFWDNLSVRQAPQTVVPEAGSMVLMCGGIPLLALALRRKKQ